MVRIIVWWRYRVPSNSETYSNLAHYSTRIENELYFCSGCVAVVIVLNLVHLSPSFEAFPLHCPGEQNCMGKHGCHHELDMPLNLCQGFQSEILYPSGMATIALVTKS